MNIVARRMADSEVIFSAIDLIEAAGRPIDGLGEGHLGRLRAIAKRLESEDSQGDYPSSANDLVSAYQLTCYRDVLRRATDDVSRAWFKRKPLGVLDEVIKETDAMLKSKHIPKTYRDEIEKEMGTAVRVYAWYKNGVDLRGIV